MAKNLPQRYGKYILLRKIAMGGMAEIFRAKTVGAEGFEKTIVIKRILPHFTEDESFVKMFIDEASIASKLQHSNIVQIFDFDQEDDRYYIAMEYVEGRDLKAVIETGLKQGKPLSPAQCAWIMMEVAKGLHYAHTKEYNGQPLNIVHRDISPHNVMVSYGGEVKLMDFGIAKAAQRSTKTMAGTVKGKCAYMSPEQARGKPLDGRSDLFALGIMLWEMLTHKRLFLGDSDFETLSNVLKADVPPPSSVNPEVPKELDAIVLRALDKDRDKRQATVEEFGRELTRWFYATVQDLDATALRPYVSALFLDEINKLRAEYEEESHMMREVSSPSQPALGSLHSERTAAIPQASDPQAAKTILDGDLSAEQVAAALAQATGKAAPNAEATVALPGGGSGQWGAAPGSQPHLQQMPGTGGFQQQATGAFPQGHTGTYAGEPPKSKAPLFAALAAVVLLGGGAAAWFALGPKGDKPSGAAQVNVEQGGGTGGETTPAPGGGEEAGTAVLVLKVDPYNAKVTVDGEPADGKVTGLRKGQKVRIVAEAPDYERLEETVTITADEQEESLTLTKAERPVTVVLKPSNPKAAVLVDGKELGTGAVEVKGLDGQEVRVEVRPPGLTETIKQTVVLSQDKPLVEIEVPDLTGKFVVAVNPLDAKVEADKGEVVQEGNAWLVRNVNRGDKVTITVSRSGYETHEEEYTLQDAAESVSVTLEKREVVVDRTPGSLFINAKPWAKVSVNGKAYGTTPTTLGSLAPGKYKVILTKGSDSAVKWATVRPGKKTTIIHDFLN